jgi:putative transposase
VPKGERRLHGLDYMIISLYAVGMTVRDIQHHLARTLGTELAHETVSKIADAASKRCGPGRPARWSRSTRSSTSTRWW